MDLCWRKQFAAPWRHPPLLLLPVGPKGARQRTKMNLRKRISDQDDEEGEKENAEGKGAAAVARLPPFYPYCPLHPLYCLIPF